MIHLTPLGTRLFIAFVVLAIAALMVVALGDMGGDVVRAPLSSI